MTIGVRHVGCQLPVGSYAGGAGFNRQPATDNRQPPSLALPRRRFLSACGIGLGRMALASLLAAEEPPLAPKPPHFPARAKSIIYLFMEGGPSQLDLFVDKPKLKAMNGQEMPKSLMAGKKFAFMDLMGAP